MLPSRSHLQAWNPESLSSAASALSDAGHSVYTAVRNLDDGCDRMPEVRAWDGEAHRAASEMFRRATDASSQFSHYTEGVATALSKGADIIGAARTALLNHADEVDRGELSVSDMWVVFIKPALVSAEKAVSLRVEANAEQAEINRLLVALGDADNSTLAQICSAAANFGFALPGPDDRGGLTPSAGFAQTTDDVPNPMTLLGLIQQGVVRETEMAQTVRESKEWATEDGQVRKTLTMMDGSRHEIYEWNDTLPCVEDTYYNKNGKELSSSFSQDKTNYDGTNFTSMKLADGTEITMTRTVDGKCTGGVTAPLSGVRSPDPRNRPSAGSKCCHHNP
ncbi:MAG TPA: hypothetical protein VFK56_16815 [Mycobacterium sp.]|nr:hypothetical protein [Mycobacterium sp.]